MKILISDKMAEEAIKMLRDAGHDVQYKEVSPEELLESIHEFHGLMVRSRTKVRNDVLDKAENLKVIGRAGIGVDNINIDYAKEKGIKVVNAPTGSTLSVAELALGHMLNLARGICRGTKAARKGEWIKKELKGTELHGKTVGIMGCGKIGQALASRCQAMGMETIGYDPYLPEEVAKEAGIELVDKNELLKRSDFITLHLALTESTKHIISEQEFDGMRNTAFLINCARGGVVDEKALYKALEEKKIAGASLDVYEEEPPGETPLLKFDNVNFTPHIGANTKEAQIKAGTICAEQMINVLNGEVPDFWVNR